MFRLYNATINIIALPELVSGVGNLQIVELQIKVLKFMYHLSQFYCIM